MNPALPVATADAPDLQRDLLAQRFDAVAQRLQPLLDALDATGETALYDRVQHDFGHLAATRPDQVHALLTEWQRQRPDSLWPPLLRCACWEQQAVQTRGETWAADVGDARWQAIQRMQAALFVQALDLLARFPMPWLLGALLTRSVQAFGEPAWMTRWLREDVRPDGVALPQDDAPVPALPAALPAVLRQAAANHTPQEGEPEALFWLVLTLRHAGHGLAALLPYAHLRTPRWGGSREEILWLADSPLAARLEEAERNRIRLIAWLDDIDVDSVDTDDADDVAQAVQRGHATLQRPLDDHSRAYLHLQLAELHGVAGQHAQAVPHLAAAVALSPRLAVDDPALIRALHAAVHTGDVYAPWLGTLAARTCQRSAHAAVLYGLLCDTGWGGVQRDGTVAEAWYRHAGTLAPLPAPEQVCPFNDVYYAFDESVQRRALLHMARCGAELGYPEMQFALGYYYSEYEDSDDPAQAIHWYRLAAAHGFPRAAYNLSLIYDRGIDAGGIAGLAPDALARLSNDCEIACLEATAASPDLSERAIDRANACLRGLRHFLTHHGDERERVARILAVLTRFGQAGWPEAMRGLGYFHALTPDPALQDFDAAVRWCEAVCRLAPDDPDNQALRRVLQGDGLLAKLRYRRAAARIRGDVLPGTEA